MNMNTKARLRGIEIETNREENGLRWEDRAMVKRLFNKERDTDEWLRTQ